MSTVAAGARKVLVVDDSASARLLIRLSVEEWASHHGISVTVTEAADAFEALRCLPRARFDVVLTDVNMPALSGLELIRMIRAHPEQKSLPIIAISTEREPADAQRAREAGADGYLGKPFESETLERLLAEIFGAERRSGMTPRPSRDEARLRREFLAEGEALLEEAANRLSSLETTGGETAPEMVNALFRAIHSLKGTAAMVGLEGYASLAHGLESVLEGMRMGRIATDATTLPGVRAGLVGLSELGVHVAAGQTDPVAPESLVAELQAAARAGRPDEVRSPADSDAGTAELPEDLGSLMTDYERHRLDESRRRDRQILLFTLDLAVESFDEGLRKGMTEAGRLGELIGTFPGAAEDLTRMCFRLLVAMPRDQDAAEVARLCGASSWSALTKPAGSAFGPAPAAPEALRPHEPEPVASAAPGVTSALPQGTVRVGLDKIGALLDLAGELSLARGALARSLERALRTATDRSARYEAQRTFTHLDRLVSALGRATLSIRLVPVEQLTSRLARAGAQLCAALGKEAEIVVFGGETEIDKILADALADPLLHLVRNALDHGIERTEDRLAAGKPRVGRIILTAAAQGRDVVFTLEDDGGGIDRARVLEKARALGILSPSRPDPSDHLELLFRPGMSTVDEISEYSGRGVGLDVVRSNVVALKGRVSVESRPGLGTVFRVVVPMTLVLLESLVVRGGDVLFSFPSSSVVRAVRAGPENVELLDGRPVLRDGGHALPLARLGSLLGVETTAECLSGGPVVIAEEEGRRVGFLVASIEGTYEMIVKPLPEEIPRIRDVSGAAEVPGGGLALTLDTRSLIERVFSGSHVPSVRVAG